MSSPERRLRLENFRATRLLAVVMAVLGVVLAGALIGSAQWVLLGVLVLFVVVVPTVVFLGMLEIVDERGQLLVFGWLIMLTAHVSLSAAGVPIGYVLEVTLFLFAVASTRNLLDRTRNDPSLRVAVILLVVNLSIGILSSLLGRSHTTAALWQFQYNLKWPLMFALGTLVAWNAKQDDLFGRIIVWTCVLVIPFVLLEVASPAMHSRLFGVNTDISGNPLLGFGRRYRGPFFHAGYLAIVCGLLGVGALCRWLTGHGARWGVIGAIYLALLFASGQRQELMAFGFVGLLLLVVIRQRYLVFSVYLLSIALSLFLAGVVYFEFVPMQETLAQWGILDSIQPLSERAILTRGGLSIAEHYFPLGSGFGTYGGAGAQRFDLSLFWDMGFGKYWWFRQGKFVVDTYWPCVIAETGYFGALALLIVFWVLWIGMFRRAWQSVGKPDFLLRFSGFAALTLLLANSPSSAVITDPRGAFIFWILIGAAWRTSPVAIESSESGHSDIARSLGREKRNYAN